MTLTETMPLRIDADGVRREIVRVGRLMYERGLVVSSDGNVSVRLDDGRILATPTQVCKGRMTEDALALVDLDGKSLNERRVSSEIKMHLLIYRERADVKAVVHAHPPHGTAFAVAGLSIDQPVLSEVILALGCVPLTPYGTPSTEELTDAMRPFVQRHNALLMANHGAVAYGADVWQAFDRMETLEHTAKITILARILGRPQNISSSDIEKLINVRERAGYLDAGARCQACGYLSEANIVCELDENGRQMNPGETNVHSLNGQNGAGTISLSREDLIELLAQVAQTK
jgi:L-fuculose-phosphate aldolase